MRKNIRKRLLIITLSVLVVIFAFVYFAKLNIPGLISSGGQAMGATCDTTDTICRAKLIREAVEARGDSAGFVLLKDLSNQNNGDCHELAHALGQSIYIQYEKNKTVNLSSYQSDCGFGFWHGFMTSYTYSHKNDISDVYNFCRKEAPSSYDCFHGIGIGLVGDSVLSILRGKEDEFMTHAGNLCDNTLSISESRGCITGSYHQAFNYLREGEFSFKKLTSESAKTICLKPTVKYQQYCLEQLAPQISLLTDNKIESISDFVTSIPKEYQENVWSTAIAGHTNRIDEKPSILLKECLDYLPDHKLSCFEGVILSIFTQKIDNNAVSVATNLCSDATLSQSERSQCDEELEKVLKRNKSRSQFKIKNLNF